MNSIIKNNEQEPLEKRFPPARIFWEDVIAIETVFREQFEEYTIEADDVEYVSSDELIDKHDSPFIRKIRIKKLIFSSSEPYQFKIQMFKEATLFSSKIDDERSRETVDQLKNILQKRVISNSVFNTPAFQKAAPITIGLMFILAFLFRGNEYLPLFFSFLGFLAGLLLFCFGHEYHKPILFVIVEPDKD